MAIFLRKNSQISLKKQDFYQAAGNKATKLNGLPPGGQTGACVPGGAQGARQLSERPGLAAAPPTPPK
jgi:hypothetical protein